MTIYRFGAPSLTVSKFVPHICKLLGDPNSQVTLLIIIIIIHCAHQRAKKVVSYSPGLLDFSIALVNSVINLLDGQVKFFEVIFKLQKNCEINLLIKTFLGLVEMIFGLVKLC